MRRVQIAGEKVFSALLRATEIPNRLSVCDVDVIDLVFSISKLVSPPSVEFAQVGFLFRKVRRSDNSAR